MNVHLLHPERDFDVRQPLPPNADALAQDLELPTLLGAMAGNDPFVLEVVRRVVLCSLSCDVATIGYRQQAVRDSLAHEAIVREMFRIATETIENERKDFYLSFSNTPGTALARSVRVLQMMVAALRRLVAIAAAHGRQFRSAGFQRLFVMLQEELTDAYFDEITDHLERLYDPSDSVLISATIGRGSKGVDYVLHESERDRWVWLRRLFGHEPDTYRFRLHPRDGAGHRALAEIRDHGLALAALTLSQAADHVLNFFQALKTELAFFIGCINLHERLKSKGRPVCFPRPVDAGSCRLSFRGLYDVCLGLCVDGGVVGNELVADGKRIVMITGANQGGKSTFLRSLGLAQLMMQCGTFVTAEALSASLCDGLFTHYKREEDATMKMGKFEEELDRMSEILDHVTSRSLVLFNESFASTNEREGSEVATQIVTALAERGVKVGFVTHMYALAHGFHAAGRTDATFLRAERLADGTRTFKLIEAGPLQTSYGQDLYREIFGATTGADERAAVQSLRR
jgi:hypothetical protein